MRDILKAKLKPDYGTCCACIDGQIDYDIAEDCTKCCGIKECEILSFGSSFWFGNYAMVLVDKAIEKVPLLRLFDVKEE